MERERESRTIADMDSDPGETRQLSTVGRYVILGSIGIGGMGLVCAAYDPKLNRKIALKLLRTGANEQASAAGRSRLFREAQALAKLSHPNVVIVHDVDVFEGQVYLAMEFVEGTTLREWLRDEPRNWRQILQKFTLAGRGLAAAHQADIIHRDFKPANVLISKDGDVRVADFGVAKDRDRGHRTEVQRELAELSSRHGHGVDGSAEDALIEEMQSNASRELTVAGRMVGTPAYMAPEQHLGLRVGPYTDQYSFCLSLFEALYGRLPFEGADRREVLTRMTEGRLPAMTKEMAARNVPGWVYKVLARGLQPHPSERWPSMEALLATLERDPIRRARRWAVVGVGVVGLSIGVAGAFVGLNEAPPPTNPCAGLGHEVKRHWNEDDRAAVRAAFARSDLPYAIDTAERVAETLDRWANEWRRSKVAICEASQTGAQSGELLDVRMDCLDQRAREVEAIVEVLREADDAIIERSVAASHALGDPDGCLTIRDTGEFGGRALAPIGVEEIVAMELELDRAHALASLEQFDQSLALQHDVVARARELAHPWTLVRGLYDLSLSQLETGDFDGGEASLREVIRLAAGLGDVAQEADAWNRLIFYVGAEHNQIVAGHAWALAAESALVRAGQNRGMRTNFTSSLAALALADGKLDAAIGHYYEALSLARAEYGERHPKTIRMLMNYAVALARAERVDEAERVMLAAIERSEQVYGPTHPWLATLHLNLGLLYIKTRQFEAAEAALRASLAITEATQGPHALALGKPLHALGKVARELDRLDEALATLERATAIFLAGHGEASNEVAAAVTDIGRTQHQLGRFADARASYDRVAAIYAVIYPDGHRHLGGLLQRQAALLVDAGLFVEAVAAADLALAVADRFALSDEFRRDVYTSLIAAELGRGRTAAAKQARARLDALR